MWTLIYTKEQLHYFFILDFNNAFPIKLLKYQKKMPIMIYITKTMN